MAADSAAIREGTCEVSLSRRRPVGVQFDQVLLYAVLALCAIGLVMV